MLYFAYGSNLDPQQMAQRCPGHSVVGVAELPDHKLTFPLTSHDWGGGVASVVETHSGSVWGVVYELSADDLAALDGYEHFVGANNPHNLYDRVSTTVQLVRPEDGSFPRRLRAWIYVAGPANPSPPSRRYLEAIVRGAKSHHLPDDYVTRLAATPVVD